MNKNTIHKALALVIVLAALLLPTTARAQAYDKEAAESYNGGAFYELIAYDTYLDELASVLKAVELNRGSATISGGSITNDDFGPSPLGSGLGILIAAGAGYAVVRRKRSRKNTTLLLACLLLLGFTQCKKEQLEPQGNGVNITLNVQNGASTCSATDGASTGSATDGAKVEVNPPHVNFETGDKILVASNGHYVGTLTHDGTNFSGDITDPVEGKPLYFYFLGNKDAGTLSAGASGSTSCTVNISDQTSELPVISMAPSTDDYSSSVTSYSASLHNKCSLMKFNVTTDSNSPIHITGMNNKVTIDFSDPEGTDNGFSYSKAGDGIIKMKGGSGTNVEKWIIVLKQGALLEDANGAYSADGSYVGTRPAIDAITENGLYFNSGINMTVNTAGDRSINLAGVTENTTINDGYRVYGTLANNVKISIADGATVTLSGVTINGTNSGSYSWAGLNCLGDATIVLADGTTNTVKGFHEDYPGIHVPNGKTLTIQGTGTLNASSNGYGAGIGGGLNIDCGNIIINSGTITATGGQDAAGIGSAKKSSCGTITISGGTVTANGGPYSAGIGSGGANSAFSSCSSSCGIITITGGTVEASGGQYGAGIGSGDGSNSGSSSCDGITISGGEVTATGGQDAAGIGSGKGYGGSSSCENITISGGTVEAGGGNYGAGIGSGRSASCSDITIANTVTRVTATKGTGASNSIGAGLGGTCGTVTIGGNVGAITTSPYTYPVPVPTGAINGLFTVNSSGDQVYFSHGNLQAVGTTSSSPSSGWTWQFAEHQYDYIGGRSNGGSEVQTGNNYINGNGTLSADGAVDLFCWSTNATYYGIHNSDDASTYSGAFYDWGNAIGDDWRTLTMAEWVWVLGPWEGTDTPNPGTNCRTSSTVNGVENARYAKATVAGKAGLIIFPDSYTHPGDVTAPASVNTTGASYTDNSYDTTAWGKMEAAGAVFLPAAGSRFAGNNKFVQACEVLGFYWSSVLYDNDETAHNLIFQEYSVDPSGSSSINQGMSVRLVRNAN